MKFDEIVDDLLKKRSNEEAADETSDIVKEEKLTAEEFVAIVAALEKAKKDSEGAVKGIRQGASTYKPDKDGIVPLPGADTQVVITTSDDITELIATTEKVELHIRITSVEGGVDTGEMCSVSIQRMVSDEWQTLSTMSLLSKPLASTGYDTIDITNIIPDGESRLRIAATGVNTTKTTYLTYESVVKAQLSLTSYIPYADPVTSDSIPLAYAITGTGVNKTLHVRVSGAKGADWKDEKQFVIGKNTYTSTNQWKGEITDSFADVVKALTHGVHKIDAWVTTTDRNGNVYSSPHVHNQVMVVKDSDDETPYIMMQEVNAVVDNYVQVSPFFKYAVYNPTQTQYTYNFVVTNYDQDKVYLSIENSTEQDVVSATIGIDDAVVGQASAAYLRVFRILRNEEGEELERVNFMSESSGDENIGIDVANEHDFTPTKGADFYINPAVRNNNEPNPSRILNDAKGNAEVQSVWTGFSHINDGWIKSEDGQNVLRILAGQHISITGYNPLARLANNPSNSMTLELDFKVSNVTNERDAIIAIANTVAASGKIIGISMTPLEGVIMTLTKNVFGEQNFGWREGYRTHVAININHQLYTDPSSEITIPIVRVFINAVPNREFLFSIGEEKEWDAGVPYSIELGQQGADIDFYCIRCYQNALSSAEIMQNYKSTLPTSEQKLTFAAMNDILASDGTISYDKARQKYSCIVHHGRPTSLMNKEATTCWLHIDHYVNGVYDKGTSGDICKESGRCPVKGQGSTAKNYPDWNQQYDPKKATESATSKEPPMITLSDGTQVQDGWIDGNGEYRGTFYQLSKDSPKAEKLVGKINYASSMQSHKAGATAAYNDLYRTVLGAELDTIMAENKNARCAVKEDVFLFFSQEGEEEPKYQGIMTFGAGKMDKKEWGYSTDKYPDFGMFEGADNDQPLANFQVPWEDSEVTYDKDDESFMYNGKANIDFDAGATDANGNPTGRALTAIKEFFNFAYRHCTSIAPWTQGGGTFMSLIEAENLDVNKQYWVVNSDATANRGDLFRYCYITKTWVPAGVSKVSSVWLTRNVFTENPTVTFSTQYDDVNKALVTSIIQRFKRDGNRYFNVESCKFHTSFVQNLLAGSDNCAKNTYYVIDPNTRKVCFHADDLDTIFKTDNVGWQTKPYYVDRVHHIDDEGKETYSGTNNAFFNTFDKAYDDELPSTMKAIFTEMEKLGGNVTGFFEKYFFSIQRGIPAVAYQEQARIRYELREMQVQSGQLSLTTVNPITQQLGDQLQSELQYMDRRLVYFMSYAAYGDWYISGNGAFGFRGFPRRDGSGARIEFTVKPVQYLYPTASFGQSLIDPHVRVAPGQPFTILVEESCKSDTTCALYGIDYYSSIGNIGDISVNPAYQFTVGGRRLTEFTATPSEGGVGEFRPSSLTFSCKLLEKVVIGCRDIGSTLDLKDNIRCVEVDVRKTSLNNVYIADGDALEILRLPDKISQLQMRNKPKLRVLAMDGYKYLSQLSIVNCSASVPTKQLVQNIYQSKQTDNEFPLKSLTLDSMAWIDVSAALLKYMAGIEHTSLQGRITVTNGQTIDAETKEMLLLKFGNIDRESNDLYVIYTAVGVTDVSVNAGVINIPSPGNYPMKVNFVPSVANNFVGIKWRVDTNDIGATIDPVTGMLNVPVVGLEENNTTVTVHTDVEMTDGSMKQSSITIKVYERIPKVGDFAYANGMFDDDLVVGMDVVGWVYKVTPYSKLDQRLLNMYLEDDEIKAAYDSGKEIYEVLVDCYEGHINCISTIGGVDYTGKGLFISYFFTWNGRDYGFTNKELEEISNSSGIPFANLIDISTITNYSDSGLFDDNGKATNISPDNVFDDYNEDGFKDFKGFAASDWYGKNNTKTYVDYSNIIINSVVPSLKNEQGSSVLTILNTPNLIPQSIEDYANLIYAIEQIAGNRWINVVSHAYLCYLYEPPFNNIHDRYKKHNWYLPGLADCIRLSVYMLNSLCKNPSEWKSLQESDTVTEDNSDIDNLNRPQEVPSHRPYYANMLKKSLKKGLTSPIVRNRSIYFWSSSETGNSKYYYREKSVEVGRTIPQGFYVRPVCAFPFVSSK